MLCGAKPLEVRILIPILRFLRVFRLFAGINMNIDTICGNFHQIFKNFYEKCKK